MRERHQDRVWRVRYRHRWLYVLVLLEFQSTVDRTMPAPECLCRGAVRVLAYSALLYQDLLRTGAEPLPPVLPIVLHHGSGRWTASVDVAGLASPSGAFLAPYQPAQRRPSACREPRRRQGASRGAHRVPDRGGRGAVSVAGADRQHHPLGADLVDGRIYGRGACDMKAGVAALVLVFVTLAEFREAWSGELVLTLVGDEETGGRWGTQYLLANVEEAVGDAMLNADTGSPRVVRIGEKGNVWVELEATGVANHAAHGHLGRNAVDTLVDALGAVRKLEALTPSLPEAVERTIAEAKVVSEAESGEGEAETLRRITVNTGRIEGGTGVNTIPDRARALCDIRIPPGVTVDRVRAELAAAIGPLPDVSWRILGCTEPSWTEPGDDVVRAVRENAAAVSGRDVVVNLRAGFSDARFWRHAGVPSAVYGVGAHHMGGVDEHATVEDLQTVFAVHAFAAFDYLRGR